MDGFQLYIFSGSQPIKGFERHWEEAYRTWKSVWTDAFKELGVEKKVYSDDFTRTSDVLALFDGETCVMVLFFRESNTNLITTEDDSYFECWPSNALVALAEYSSGVGITNYVTIPQACRGDYKGLRLKHLMMAFIRCYILESKISALAGTTRNDRGVDKATSAVGARLLDPSIKLHGVEVNLVGFFREEMRNVDNGYGEIAFNLWNQRIDHRLKARSRGLRAA